MDKENFPGARDEVIVRAFRRSLLLVFILAALLAAVFAARRIMQREEIHAEAPTPAPVAVHTVAQAPPVSFSDITRQAGIAFTHSNGAYGEKLLPETMGSGAAFFDYDNDGDQDLLLVNSSPWPHRETPTEVSPTMALYQNDGSGSFSDVTAMAGLARPLYGMGVAVGDYDNDGDGDLYITAFGGNKLFRNEVGHFVDITDVAGVAGADATWSTSAAFFDADRDGDLDLFVANYVRWSRELDLEVNYQLTGIGRAYGPPNAYGGTHSYLYLNAGNGKFLDVSASAGIAVDNPATGAPMGKALAVVPVDIDSDGWMDLLVANDTVQNFLFHNRGDGSFEEQGARFGIAFDRDGKATGAMGADVAHFRNDVELGLVIGNFANEMSSLYVTHEAAFPMSDAAIVEGIGPASRRALTFGLFFFDYDLDGRLDLLQANGHLEGEINRVQSSQQYRQSPQLFWNCGANCRSSYLPLPVVNSGDLGTPLVGRGASYADIDGDGDLDVLITQNGGPPLLLRNDQALAHHWLRVKLVGTAVNRDAIGAWVEVRSGGMMQRRQVMPSRSYLSQVELPLTFGLATNDSVDSVRISWPDGSEQILDQVAVDTLLRVKQQPSVGEGQQ